MEKILIIKIFKRALELKICLNYLGIFEVQIQDNPINQKII